MPSPSPLQPGQYYHIYNRGNNREDVFVEERNYSYFLKLYAQHIQPVVDTYAYCLLKNHFHVLVRIKTVEEQEQTFRVSETLKVFKAMSPSRQFGNLFNAYAKAINKAYGRTGSLFEHPFSRVPVTTDAHFVALIVYIHQNPQKHGFVPDFRDWPYSSYNAFLSQMHTRLKRDEVLAWFQGMEAFEVTHRRMMGHPQIAPLVPEDLY